MTQTTLTKDAEGLLPESMRRAQEAINLPEVQDMVRALSEYGLGVFMPHMHNDDTGGFEPLPRRRDLGGGGTRRDVPSR